jgi:hypothetical protein
MFEFNPNYPQFSFKEVSPEKMKDIPNTSTQSDTDKVCSKLKEIFVKAYEPKGKLGESLKPHIKFPENEDSTSVAMWLENLRNNKSYFSSDDYTEISGGLDEVYALLDDELDDTDFLNKFKETVLCFPEKTTSEELEEAAEFTEFAQFKLDEYNLHATLIPQLDFKFKPDLAKRLVENFVKDTVYFEKNNTNTASDRINQWLSTYLKDKDNTIDRDVMDLIYTSAEKEGLEILDSHKKSNDQNIALKPKGHNIKLTTESATIQNQEEIKNNFEKSYNDLLNKICEKNPNCCLEEVALNLVVKSLIYTENSDVSHENTFTNSIKQNRENYFKSIKDGKITIEHRANFNNIVFDFLIKKVKEYYENSEKESNRAQAKIRNFTKPIIEFFKKFQEDGGTIKSDASKQFIENLKTHLTQPHFSQ